MECQYARRGAEASVFSDDFVEFPEQSTIVFSAKRLAGPREGLADVVIDNVLPR